MKLNGALKPRQGASIQGSFPGVVFRSYRVKRFYKVNGNVDNVIPLNECGVNNANLTKKINNNICIINNQQKQRFHQQQTALLTKQQKQQIKKKCGEINNIRNSDNNNIHTHFYYCTKIKKTNKFTTINACIGLRSHKFKTQSTLSAEAVAVADTETETETYTDKDTVERTAIENKNNRKEINNEIDLKQIPTFDNITTRQIKYTKKTKKENNKNYKNNSSESNNRIINNNKDESKTKQVKVVKTTSNTYNYNVIFNRSHIKTNNNNSNKCRSSSVNTYYKEVNKFLLLISKIYENLNLTFIISRLFIQLKLLLFFMFSHAVKLFTRNTFANCNRGYSYIAVSATCCHSFSLMEHKLAKIMRASNSLECSFERIFSKNMNQTRIHPSIALYLMVYVVAVILLPQPVVGDDGENFFPINGIETTTPEFDYASRGQKKFGDKCENTLECGFPGSICDPKKKSCQCTEDLPVTNHIDKCGKEAAVNESCFFNEQCEMKYFQTECRDQKCVCRFDMTPVWLKDGSVECKGRGDKKGPETYIDPAMIGVLIGMALMFIIICVVLRLFSQARWRENRTIFNTPNPRLMNVSLLRESKLLHGQERRGSRMSVRAPSRQPSMASLRPHSPNPSLGKTGRMTRSKSNTRSSDSRVSDASNCSRLLEHHTANTHHASHTHANTTPYPSTSNHISQANVSPLSINAPTTTITNMNRTPVAVTTTCSSNLTTPPPTIRNKSNKF